MASTSEHIFNFVYSGSAGGQTSASRITLLQSRLDTFRCRHRGACDPLSLPHGMHQQIGRLLKHYTVWLYGPNTFAQERREIIICHMFAGWIIDTKTAYTVPCIVCTTACQLISRKRLSVVCHWSRISQCCFRHVQIATSPWETSLVAGFSLLTWQALPDFQVGNLTPQQYHQWVYSPRLGAPRFFGRILLESISKTSW